MIDDLTDFVLLPACALNAMCLVAPPRQGVVGRGPERLGAVARSGVKDPGVDQPPPSPERSGAMKTSASGQRADDGRPRGDARWSLYREHLADDGPRGPGDEEPSVRPRVRRKTNS